MFSLSTPSIWKIYVRFQNFPVQYILNCNQNNNIEKYYFHSLKQAIFVLHNSTRIFNELSIHQQQLLWLSIKNCNQQLYEDILKQSHFIPELLESFSSSALPSSSSSSSSSLLLPSSTSSSIENNYQQLEVISLPIRVLHDDKPTLQRPVRMNIEKQMLQTKTLRQVLSIDFNIHIYNTTNNDDDEHNYDRNDSSCDIYDDDDGNTCDNNDNHQHNDNNSYDQHYSGNSNRSCGIKNINNNTSSSSSSSSNYNIKVVVHGIEVPLDAPIYTLWLLMHHCDLWLYIIICSSSSSRRSSSSSSRSNNIVIKP